VHHGRGNFRGTGPDDGRPAPHPLLARGDVTKPGALVQPGASVRDPSRALPSTDRRHPKCTSRRAGAQWIDRARQPAHLAQHRQPHLAAAVRPRPGRDPERLRQDGRAPSHPELLDWLAVEFRDGGQSFKKLDRLIVTSATYRQDSRVSAACPRAIPKPSALAHEPAPSRRGVGAGRLLAVSGNWTPRCSAPGFQDFVVEKPEHSPHYQYHLHDPEDPRTHRRSVYRFLVRSQQEPFMTALDCADPSMRVDRRNETLTPLQALAMLNSRLTVAMAPTSRSRRSVTATANRTPPGDPPPRPR
jgi:hypothetical protein